MRFKYFAAPPAVPLAYYGLLALVALLKVPHHGSREAVNEDLLAVTGPQLAVISVGQITALAIRLRRRWPS